MQGQRKQAAESSFKDYCLILQVHPDAEVEIIDAAYWHLAKRYSQTRLTDAAARARMDDLNEAYSVLRSPERREAFNRQREEYLGAGALPAALPARAERDEPLPLPVMERGRQRLASHDPEAAAVGGPTLAMTRISIPAWQPILAAMVILTLALVGLSGWIDRPFLIALLAVGLGITAVPLLRGLVPAAPRLATPIPMPAPVRPEARPADLAAEVMSRPPEKQPPQPSADADAIRKSTEAIRNRLRDAQPGDKGPQRRSSKSDHEAA
jgi:hypothetical protein